MERCEGTRGPDSRARVAIGARPNISAAIAELLDLMERRAAGDAATEGRSSPREARKTLAILLAILRSQHQGNVPIVAPFADAN